jgi:hypothetical protein
MMGGLEAATSSLNHATEEKVARLSFCGGFYQDLPPLTEGNETAPAAPAYPYRQSTEAARLPLNPGEAI